jgi:hypothetical protein
VCLTARTVSYLSGITSWSCHGTPAVDVIRPCHFFLQPSVTCLNFCQRPPHGVDVSRLFILVLLFPAFNVSNSPSSQQHVCLIYFFLAAALASYIYTSSLITLDKVGRDDSPATTCPCMIWYTYQAGVLSHCLRVGHESARITISRYRYLSDATSRFWACQLQVGAYYAHP